MITEAPSRASARQVALPMPFEPPVTRATLPLREAIVKLAPTKVVESTKDGSLQILGESLIALSRDKEVVVFARLGVIERRVDD